jgi:HK97 family phage prohead protease
VTVRVGWSWRFDPEQPRDHHGRWTNGLPDVIALSEFSLGGLPSGVASVGDGDRVHLAVGDAQLDVSREQGIDQILAGLQGTGQQTMLGENHEPILRLTHPLNEDDWSVDAEFVGQGVTVHLTPGDRQRWIDELLRAQVARRVEIASGPLDVWLPKNKFGLRFLDDAGNPKELEFNHRSWARLSKAIDVVWGDPDEDGTFGEPYAAHSQLTVKTNVGNLLVDTVDEGGQEMLRFAPAAGGGWRLVWSADSSDPYFDAVGAARDVAENLDNYDSLVRSAPLFAPSRRRMMFGGAMTARRAQAMAAAGIQTRAAMSGHQRRAFPVELQVRAAGAAGGASVVEGYASVTDYPYEMWDPFGSYTEVVRAGAFTKTLSENPQVQLLLNHGGLSMAYTRAGTLTLAEDSTGLHIRAELNPTRGDVADMLAAIRDGNVDEMSFAFRVPEGKSLWSPDWSQRDIAEVDMHRGDVSVVNFGANDGTAGSLAVRAGDFDLLDERSARALYERLGARLAAGARPAAPTTSEPAGSLALFEAELALLG